MEKRFLQSLLKRFGDFTRGEVEHYALLAELRQESERLAFRRAVYDMMDERRRRAERLKMHGESKWILPPASSRLEGHGWRNHGKKIGIY